MSIECDAIQPSHPLWPPPQGLFQRVSSLHEVAIIVERQISPSSEYYFSSIGSVQKASVQRQEAGDLDRGWARVWQMGMREFLWARRLVYSWIVLMVAELCENTKNH